MESTNVGSPLSECAEVFARFARSASWRENGSPFARSHMGRGFSFPTTPHPGEPRMATKPVTAKLRLRLELIAALPAPILLDRLRRLSVAELILFRRLYGIRECRCQGPCTVQHFMLRATSAVKLGRSRRLAARLARELRNNPPSMYQTRCQCAACRQATPRMTLRARSRGRAFLLRGPR